MVDERTNLTSLKRQREGSLCGAGCQPACFRHGKLATGPTKTFYVARGSGRYLFAPRRAAVTLAVSAFLFALMSVLLAAAVEAEWVGLRDPLYADKAGLLKRCWAGCAPDTVKVLALGSSRTTYGLNGREASARLGAEIGRPAVVFNFGVPAAGSVTQWLYLRRLLADGVWPDLVLVEVLPPFLAGQCLRPAEADWLTDNRLRPSERKLAARYGILAATHNPRKWANRLAPWFAYRYAVLNEVAPGWLPGTLRLDRSRGAGLNDCGDTSQEGTQLPEAVRLGNVEQTRRQFADAFAGYCPGGLAAAALHDFLADCRGRDLPVVMVVPPESGAFRGWYDAAALDRFLATLGTPCIDARLWVPDEFFVDGHHLTRLGAELYSDRLARELAPLARVAAPPGGDHAR
jgi:hypothetical protein